MKILGIGLDLGSTTAKFAVVDSEGKILESDYRRHGAAVKETALTLLRELQVKYPDTAFELMLTGSAALDLAVSAGAGFIQEVIASSRAIKRVAPDTDVAIELGGEDAKILYLSDGMELRMNEVCAGGTGAFIDQMASLLNTDASGLNKLAADAKTIYPVASRCGVFAKTDVVPLLNAGSRREDVAASILQAVVDQSIAGLAQGRNIEGNVLFLGGPLHFLKGLQERFKETLKLRDQEANFPELAPYFVALGSAVYAANEAVDFSYEELLEKMEAMAAKKIQTQGLPPLFESDEDYEEFKKRHTSASVERSDIHTYRGNAYLGIDAGSTTTKVALVGEDGSLLYSFYSSNNGSPLATAISSIKEIKSLLPDSAKIAYSCSTG